MNRELVGILVIAVVASTLLLVTIRLFGSADDVAILAIEVPEALLHGNKEYRIVASLVVQNRLSSLEFRYRWLERRGGTEYKMAATSWNSTMSVGPDLEKAWGRIPKTQTIFSTAEEVEFRPRSAEERVTTGGEDYRILFYDFSEFEEFMIPRYEAPPPGEVAGEPEKNRVNTQYGLLVGEEENLAGFFTGIADFFFDDQSIKSLRVLAGEDTVIYGDAPNATGDLRTIAELPALGTLSFEEPEQDTRIDLVLVLDGRRLPFHSQYLLVIEIRTPDSSEYEFFFVR